MALTLKQSQAISKLAKHLYDYLPGNAHPFASQSSSFEGAARELGLGAFWPAGSKLPAITSLLSGTLESSGDFSKLMIEIVKRAIGYRQNRANPLTRDDLRELNALIEGVGFKIPELRDPAFIDALPRGKSQPEPSSGPSATEIGELRTAFAVLTVMAPQPRGYAFEEFLNHLFKVHGLDPREPFRLVGEQIDGSFQLIDDTYLAEARYRNEPADQAALLALSGKVSGKALWSRGLFISYAGFTRDGLEAFARGKPTNIICMDGLDLHHVLDGNLDLGEVIRRKARRAAETNAAFVPVRELFPGVI